jgi:lysyl-tRNA synthetase class I
MNMIKRTKRENRENISRTIYLMNAMDRLNKNPDFIDIVKYYLEESLLQDLSHVNDSSNFEDTFQLILSRNYFKDFITSLSDSTVKDSLQYELDNIGG